MRFDDCCPAMNWTIWRTIEDLLLREGIRPIVAVVPDNQDPTLKVQEPNDNFWSEVRSWQARGWTIGMHGYQHLCTTRSPGILGTKAVSEFSGLSYAEQRHKLEMGLAIFRREQVKADVWVAPGHSFDETTLRALKDLGLPTVSDGHFLFPHQDACGIHWLPQQFWRFRWMPFGVWTVCLHINTWTNQELGEFRRAVRRFRDFIVDAPTALARHHGNKSGLDCLFETTYQFATRARRSFRQAKGECF